ncbi:MAG: hypothetical protein JRE45_03000 [Deltaproteobacteria bacterium]|nr:hypothetical protein [Deltaproteobacteria bacterium]
MKLGRLFVIALLAGTLGVLGCGDDETNGTGGTAGSGGTAGMGGNGGTGGAIDPNELCNIEACAIDSDIGRAAKAVCIDEINSCIAAGILTTEECIAFGTETCTV